MPFGNLKLYFYGAIVLLVLSGLGFSHYKAYNAGYDSSETKRTKEIAEINLKSAEVLNQQIEEHNRFVNNQSAAIKALQEEDDRLDKIQKENEREANQDSNAKRPSFSKSSVLRLNRIR